MCYHCMRDLPQCPHLIWLKRQLCMDFGMCLCFCLSMSYALLFVEFSLMFFTPTHGVILHRHRGELSSMCGCELVCVLSASALKIRPNRSGFHSNSNDHSGFYMFICAHVIVENAASHLHQRLLAQICPIVKLSCHRIELFRLIWLGVATAEEKL